MKGKVVLVQFPFDDLSSSKVRPAYCLTSPIGVNRHVIFALITSRIPTVLLDTDIVLDAAHPDFVVSGLLKPSTLRLDHVITLKQTMVRRELGELSVTTQEQICEKLCALLSG
jgi:mRNA interferase MazF